MRDAWTIFRREFRAFVRSRAYVLATLFGPLMNQTGRTKKSAIMRGPKRVPRM